MNRDDLHVKVRHEPRDVNARKLAAIAGSLLVLAVIGNFGLHGFFDELNTANERSQPPAHPLAAPLVPPEPRLQVNAPLDLERIRARESENLNGYSWIDRKAGRVRIPIARAMELIAEHLTEAKP